MSECASITMLNRKADGVRDTVSGRIRSRLDAAGRRYYANDNIADFIHDGELDALRSEVEDRLQDVLRTLVIDTAHDHNSNGTARRVARMFIDEVFRGRYVPPPVATTFPNVAHLAELMIVGPIKVRSACAHHLCPIMGKVWIGILPDPASRLLGLSKYARICDWVMSRPQIQEEASVMLADELERRLRPRGLGVVMEASHFCVQWRGVKDAGSHLRNTVMRGALAADDGLRAAFLAQLPGRLD
ncbi:MAG TPA: GTP cyclohydrolase I [Rhodanobacteraceae bacterium]